MQVYLHRKNFRQVIKRLFIFITSFFIFAKPVGAAEWSGVCVGKSGTAAEDVATLQGIQCLVANILINFLTIIGMAGFVMLIYGSLMWLLSGGSSSNIEKAKKTFTFAIVGLIVALSSFIIVRLVSQFTGVASIVDFFLPTSDKTWENLAPGTQFYLPVITHP